MIPIVYSCVGAQTVVVKQFSWISTHWHLACRFPRLFENTGGFGKARKAFRNTSHLRSLDSMPVVTNIWPKHKKFATIEAWVYVLFPFFREELPGVCLDVRNLFSTQLLANVSIEIGRLPRNKTVCLLGISGTCPGSVRGNFPEQKARKSQGNFISGNSMEFPRHLREKSDKFPRNCQIISRKCPRKFPCGKFPSRKFPGNFQENSSNPLAPPTLYPP